MRWVFYLSFTMSYDRSLNPRRSESNRICKSKRILRLATDFWQMWWLLKEPLFLQVRREDRFTFYYWCTWSQPWFLHWWSVWPIHPVKAAGPRSESHASSWSCSCHTWSGERLRRQPGRGGRWRTNSWCSCLFYWYQCLGELASELCWWNKQNCYDFSLLVVS